MENIGYLFGGIINILINLFQVGRPRLRYSNFQALLLVNLLLICAPIGLADNEPSYYGAAAILPDDTRIRLVEHRMIVDVENERESSETFVLEPTEAKGTALEKSPIFIDVAYEDEIRPKYYIGSEEQVYVKTVLVDGQPVKISEMHDFFLNGVNVRNRLLCAMHAPGFTNALLREGLGYDGGRLSRYLANPDLLMGLFPTFIQHVTKDYLGSECFDSLVKDNLLTLRASDVGGARPAWTSRARFMLHIPVEKRTTLQIFSKLSFFGDLGHYSVDETFKDACPSEMTRLKKYNYKTKGENTWRYRVFRRPSDVAVPVHLSIKKRSWIPYWVGCPILAQTGDFWSGTWDHLRAGFNVTVVTNADRQPVKKPTKGRKKGLETPAVPQ